VTVEAEVDIGAAGYSRQGMRGAPMISAQARNESFMVGPVRDRRLWLLVMKLAALVFIGLPSAGRRLTVLESAR
jgi:hypothetical protein